MLWRKLVGSKIDVKLKKKPVGTLDASIIMVPIAYQGHMFALNFISEKKLIQNYVANSLDNYAPSRNQRAIPKSAI